jgi:multicomponent Na+:H+ antiporter subunit F
MPAIVAGIPGFVPAVLSLLAIAALIAFVRLVRGPSLADRVVAVEVIGAIVVAFIVVVAIQRDEQALVDVALVFALVSFIGTLGFARFVLKGPRDV